MLQPTSVVVTTLNEEKTVEKLITVLLSQTKKPDEIIVVNGGSKDNTLHVLKKFKNPALKIFLKKGNRAVGRNYGIKKARSEIIAVTDAGGYPKRDWLEKLVAPFKNPNVQVVSGYYQAFAKTPFEKCVAPYFLVMPDKIQPWMEFLPASRSVAFRKSVWKRVGGYPEQYSHNEDLVFAYKLKEAGVKFFFEPRAQVFWYPPQNLFEASRKFFRFALGDAEAGIARPKVKFIFVRYLAGIILFILGWYQLLISLILIYVAWSIWKNKNYVPASSSGWFPIIQVISDIAVMAGTGSGVLLKR